MAEEALEGKGGAERDHGRGGCNQGGGGGDGWDCIEVFLFFSSYKFTPCPF